MTAPYRFYKWDISAGNSATEIAVTEAQLYKSTTNIANGKTATSNGYHSGYPPSKLTDNSINAWYLNVGAPYWFMIDIGTPDYIDTYKLQAHNSWQGLMMKSWVLTGSYDGLTWYTIDTRSNETGWGAAETRTYTPNGTYAISGIVRDSGGSFAQRTVRVYRRDTGKLLNSADSSASTGAYSIAVEYASEVNVVMLDDVSGTVENDQIHRSTPV